MPRKFQKDNRWVKFCSNTYCEENNPQEINAFYKDKSRIDGLQKRCKTCNKNSSKNWRNENPMYHKDYNEKWNEENSEYYKKYYMEHRVKKIVYARKWKKENPDYYKNWCRNNSNKFGIYNARRNRELGYNELYDNPFFDDVIISWHHIDNINVVAIPRDVHRQCGGYNRETHRLLLWPIVKDIYPDIEEKIKEQRN